MYLHEYQSKQLLGAYGMPLPAGRIAHSAQEAVEVAHALGGASWMVKAQVHAGARGKAGGVQRANSSAEVERIASALIGSHLVTERQTSPPAAGAGSGHAAPGHACDDGRAKN